MEKEGHIWIIGQDINNKLYLNLDDEISIKTPTNFLVVKLKDLEVLMNKYGTKKVVMSLIENK